MKKAFRMIPYGMGWRARFARRGDDAAPAIETITEGDKMIEIFKDGAGEWRFRVKGANGEIVASSEGYTRKADALRGIDTLRRLLNDAKGEPVREVE